MVDFAVGLVEFILHLPNVQVKVLGEFHFKKINLIHHACDYFFRASKIYFWSSTAWLQLV